MKKTLQKSSFCSIRQLITITALFMSSMAFSQTVFWLENFNNGCTSLCPVSGYTGVNGPWTMIDSTPALLCSIAVSSNQWYVSCAENGHTPGVCATGCMAADSTSTLATLHIGNVPTSPAAPVFCPTGDCGARYDGGGFCDVGGIPPSTQTDKRAVSPNINCLGRNNITLSFNYITKGDPGNDYGQVEYSDDGGTSWYFLASPNASILCDTVGQWASYSFLLPSSCDNNPGVKIGFRWINNDDGNGTDPSFAVDNVSLSAMGIAGILLGLSIFAFVKEPEREKSVEDIKIPDQEIG